MELGELFGTEGASALARGNDTVTNTGPSSGLHVLVVDDNADCAETTAMLLRTYGHSAEIAQNAASALEAIQRRRPHVVLLDISLPGMTGWELAKQIRQQFESTRPLLIAVTGWARQEDRQHSAESGIDVHLAKPADPEELRGLLDRFKDTGELISDIRLRAYELWQRVGGPEGQDTEHWLQAERELRAERAATEN
jgi:CheY-like chemotaxis protein